MPRRWPRISPSTWRSGRSRSGGASSTKSRRRRWVSSTRRSCAHATKKVSSSLNNWIEQRRTGEFAEAAQGVVAAPAATVVLLRDGETGLEVLLARRSSKLAFHGGAWVFPGGRIDPDDYADAPDDLPRAARRRRSARGEGGSGGRRRPRSADPPLQLDDARRIAEALRDVVLCRAGARWRRSGRRLRDGQAAVVQPGRRVGGADGRRDRARAAAVRHPARAPGDRDGCRRDEADRGRRRPSTTCRASTSSRVETRSACIPRTSRTTISRSWTLPALATAWSSAARAGSTSATSGPTSYLLGWGVMRR